MLDLFPEMAEGPYYQIIGKLDDKQVSIVVPATDNVSFPVGSSSDLMNLNAAEMNALETALQRHTPFASVDDIEQIRRQKGHFVRFVSAWTAGETATSRFRSQEDIQRYLQKVGIEYPASKHKAKPSITATPVKAPASGSAERQSSFRTGEKPTEKPVEKSVNRVRKSGVEREYTTMLTGQREVPKASAPVESMKPPVEKDKSPFSFIENPEEMYKVFESPATEEDLELILAEINEMDDAVIIENQGGEFRARYGNKRIAGASDWKQSFAATVGWIRRSGIKDATIYYVMPDKIKQYDLNGRVIEVFG